MITTAWSGLTVGAIYAIIAIGYNITITTAGVLNFAFANIVMLGAFVTISGLALGLPIPVALLLAALVGAIVSIVEERVAIRFIPRGAHAELITTIGAATVITGASAIIWGAEPQRMQLFDQAPITLLGGQVLPHALIMIAAAILLGVLLNVFNRRTKYGIASLAHAADREATMLRGVNVRWMSIIAFAAAGAIGAFLGPLVAMTTTASPFIPIVLAVKGFIVLTCGGVGSQTGALVAGLGIGLIEAFTNLAVGPNYGDFAVFLIFVAVLLIRPQGIFGTRMLRFV
jgi:branched-chain amino acid transport system permease protein